MERYKSEPRKEATRTNWYELISYFLWYKRTRNVKRRKKILVSPIGRSANVSSNKPVTKARKKTGIPCLMIMVTYKRHNNTRGKGVIAPCKMTAMVKNSNKITNICLIV